MRRVLMSAAALSLLAAPAFAQAAMTTTSETTQWSSSPAAVVPQPMVIVPAQPVVVPAQPSPVYEQRTVIEPAPAYSTRTVSHSENGVARTDSTTEKYYGPDGSSRTVTRTVEQDYR